MGKQDWEGKDQEGRGLSNLPVANGFQVLHLLVSF